jgi:tetratricopeptide (TPR) repeat protein
MAKGMPDKASEVLEYYLEQIGENAAVREKLARTYIWKGNYSQALIEAEKALLLDPTHFRNNLIKGDIYNYMGNFEKAEEEYQKLLDTGEHTAQNDGIMRLLDLYLLLGRFQDSLVVAEHGVDLAELLGDKDWESKFQVRTAYSHLKAGETKKALEAVNKAQEAISDLDNLNRKKEILFCKALIHFEDNSLDEAQVETQKIKTLIESGLNKNHWRYYFYLQGKIEMQKCIFAKAIEFFEKALSLSSNSYTAGEVRDLSHDSLAKAYLRAGEKKKAIVQYRNIGLTPRIGIFWGDIYVKSFYELARIQQESNITRLAVRNFERFLDLWKNADTEIPELIDARKQLAALKN